MDVKKIVLLVGALIIAGVTAFMAKSMFTGAAAPQAQASQQVPAGPEVLVATRTLSVGTIIDPEALWTVDPAQFFSKGHNTPYAGVVMKGRVVATFFNGKRVYERGVVP